MKWICRIIIAIFLFGMGWMFGLLIEHWDIFHLSFDVPAFNIINLLVISFLAWYVNNTIQNQNRRNKSKTDLLSSKLDEVDTNLKRIVDLCVKDNGASYIEICNLDKRNRSWTKTITETLEKRYKDVCQEGDYKTLMTQLTDLRALLMQPPIITDNDNNDVIVDKNIVKYSTNRAAYIEVTCEAIRHQLFDVKVGISQK